MRQTLQAQHEVKIAGLLPEPSHERLIELHDVDGKFAQVDQRRIGTADIVQRDADAEVPDRLQARGHSGEVRGRVPLQQL